MILVLILILSLLLVLQCIYVSSITPIHIGFISNIFNEGISILLYIIIIIIYTHVFII